MGRIWALAGGLILGLLIILLLGPLGGLELQFVLREGTAERFEHLDRSLPVLQPDQRGAEPAPGPRAQRERRGARARAAWRAGTRTSPVPV